MSKQRFIVVEGPVGVGKTGLARRLARHMGAELVLEKLGDNPFLERLLEDPGGAAFPAQLFFLFERAQQYASIRQPDLFSGVQISDFMVERDHLFAEVGLDEAEYKLYEQVYGMLINDLPRPDLVVYLQVSAESLLERIRERGNPQERHIDLEYLQQVVDVYARFFLAYQGAPVLIVNAETLNPAEKEEDFNLLLPRILETRNGRHYFNPEPMLW